MKANIYKFLETLFMSFKKIPFGNTKSFNVVVEVPTGGKKKYEYDPEMDAIRLDKILYGEFGFPFNYGHVAKTISHDNYPLDAFVFSTYPITTGTVVACRSVGLLEVIDRAKRDNKILAIPVHEKKFDHIQDIADVPKEYLDKLMRFYEHILHHWDQDIKIKGIKDKAAAVKELLWAQESEE